MAQYRLVLDEDRHGLFRIFWYIPEYGDLGACLGDWYTRSGASKALAAAKAALTIHRSAKPWPEWAKQALAAGWKAPKGWKP